VKDLQHLIDAVEAIGVAVADREAYDLDFEQLAVLLDGLGELRRTIGRVEGDVKARLVDHVEYGHPRPVEALGGRRLRRTWEGAVDIWDDEETALLVVERPVRERLDLGAHNRRTMSIAAQAVDAAVHAILQVSTISWRKGKPGAPNPERPGLRDLGIEPNEAPKKPKPGVEYLGLCQSSGGHPSVAFE
jgi:hypothetical protein